MSSHGSEAVRRAFNNGGPELGLGQLMKLMTFPKSQA